MEERGFIKVVVDANSDVVLGAAMMCARATDMIGEFVSAVANKLTANPNFDMYIHVDAKADIAPFQELLKDNKQVFFLENIYRLRHQVYTFPIYVA